MNSKSDPQNRYTDTPKLQPNLLLGSVRLLLWLFFTHQRGGGQVARLDDFLSSDIYLITTPI